VLTRILENFADMPLRESRILEIHRDLLRHSDKDERQRGTYKFGPNRVEARDADGRVVDIIFDPTPPHLTPKEMSELLAWLAWADESGFKHPLLRIANFVFEFLAIHPFQDGNGRVSRLITNLLLLRNGYAFAALVSHERLIEARKAEYYLALRRTQATWKSADEDIFPWLFHFLSIVQAQAREAIALIERDHVESLLSEKQLALWRWAAARHEPTFTRREAAAALGFPPRTVEGIVVRLLGMKRIERLGRGRATRYRVLR
jgi:Fic family protein